jgi:hypothetical protein
MVASQLIATTTTVSDDDVQSRIDHILTITSNLSGSDRRSEARYRNDCKFVFLANSYYRPSTPEGEEIY